MTDKSSYPKFNEQKTTEAASVLLRLEGGEMNYMKLIKLLYFADRRALQEWERPITQDFYYSMKDGQVLSTVLDFVRNRIIGVIWHEHIKPASQYRVKLPIALDKIQELSPAEIELLENIYSEYGKYNQYELGDLTKKGAEYKETSSRVQTDLEDLLSALGFSKSKIARISERLEEKANIDSLFVV